MKPLVTIKQDHSPDGLLADRAKSRGTVGFHPAVLVRTVYPLLHVASSFKHSDRILVFICLGSRHGSVFRDHILPFGIKIDIGSNVGLLWFYLQVVGIGITHIADIFIGETGKRVAEFMDSDNIRPVMVGSDFRVMIEEAAAAV